MTQTIKRKEYGVFIDRLHEHVAKTLQVRVGAMRKQIADKKYRELDEEAQRLYEIKVQQQSTRSMYVGEKPATVSGQRFHLLCTATGAMFMVYQYQHVDSDVKVCIEHGTPVFVFSPYKVPDLVCVTSLSHWSELVEAERASNKTFHVNAEYAALCYDQAAELTSILNTPIPWINEGYRLHSLIKECGSFPHLLEYAQARIAEIEEQGEYDIELTHSVVMKEKMSTAHFVGKDGKRTFWCSDNPERTEYWTNYEILPVDILKKFIHLTYLDAIDYKPLRRMFTDGRDFNGKELWFGTCQEDMLRTTPIYVDPYADHTDELYDILAELGGKAKLKAMGYEEAKKLLSNR